MSEVAINCKRGNKVCRLCDADVAICDCPAKVHLTIRVICDVCSGKFKPEETPLVTNDDPMKIRFGFHQAVMLLKMGQKLATDLWEPQIYVQADAGEQKVYLHGHGEVVEWTPRQIEFFDESWHLWV